jgi:hypothetical protein
LNAVIDFIKDKGAREGEVYTTRIIRTLTGHELRDEEKGAVDLPSNTSCREMYEKFCFDRGWAPKSDSKGRYPKVCEYPNRKTDDMFWRDDADQMEVCSWWSFCEIWKEHCSNIQIHGPCTDTCGECTVFSNAFRYRESRKKEEDEEEGDSEDDDDVLDEPDDPDQDQDAAFKDDEIVVELAKSFLTGDCLEQERILEAAGNHVHQAKGMRHYVQERTVIATQCRNEEVPHHEREYVIVYDYAPNLPLPHYGGEQTGEINYFSDVTINLFGIVDLSLAPNKLTCYAYREFTAKKRSNNVASLLMKDLFDKLWLWKGTPGKKLTIAMDNCGGQNKNNVVLRFALYLVGMRYFLTVEFVFYIRGHTKNACDRMFNQMKLKYHKKDIFSWSQALETLNTKENVRIVDDQEAMFKDFGALLNKFYGSIKAGTVQKNHIFKVEHTDEKLNMQCAVHDGALFVNQPMLKRGQVLGKDHTAAIDAFVVAALKPPGLRPIKQVELYKKFHTFFPRRFWDDTCPKPSDEVLMQVNDETTKKRKQKTAPKPPQVAAVKPAATKPPKATVQAKKRRAAGEAAKKQGQKKPKVKKRQAAPESDTDSDWSVSE